MEIVQGRKKSDVVQRDRNVRMPNLPKSISADEKKYLLAVERGDLASVRRMIQKAHNDGDLDINCMDPLGRNALLMAIESEQFSMVELLVVMGVKTSDALLHAIEQEFVEAVELLLEHEELIHKEDDLYSWEKIDRDIATFTPEITPLILAAHRNNYEILKILLDRGAAIPMPHDIRCICEDCFRALDEDSLRHSACRINSYKALASPSLIALTSVDPLLTAFELSWELKQLSVSENEFRGEYSELRMRSQTFAVDLLSHIRTSHELEVMLNYDPYIMRDEEDMDIEADDKGDKYEDGLARLRLAIKYKQKKFVAHPWVQQLLGAIWYAGLPGFRKKTTVKKCVEIAGVILSFQFYCLLYMIAPKTTTGKLLRKPFMKFLIHSSSYLFFLLLLILVSQRVEEQLIDWWESHKHEAYSDGSIYRKIHRGNPPRYLELTAALYLVGFIWEEVRELIKSGCEAYTTNLWNAIEVLRNFLYVLVISLRLWAYLEQRQEILMDPERAYIPKEYWNEYDPQLISEGLFAAANIFSALKLVQISSINPHLGPLQISLGRMIVDILKFFFFYSLVLFAFACGLNQLLWYFADLEKDKCYSLPGGLPDWSKNADACMKWRRFGNLFESSQSLFWASFGMVSLADFELTGIKSYTRFWALLMFGSYSVINVIVLLNLLIAMMSNSYATIAEKADTEWKFARTQLWLTYFDEDATLPSPFNLLPTLKQLKRLLFKFLPFLSKNGSISKHKEARLAELREQAREYTAVMRALVWRYVSGKQRQSEENPVTEDDINEVKTEISALRYDIFEVFRSNGYQVNSSNKKPVALSKKTREWERRLFRGFHVAPAAGDEDVLMNVQKEIEKQEESEQNSGSGADRFRSLARLALLNRDRLSYPPKHLAHIGRSNSSESFKSRQSLKKAMAQARKNQPSTQSPKIIKNNDPTDPKDLCNVNEESSYETADKLDGEHGEIPSVDHINGSGASFIALAMEDPINKIQNGEKLLDVIESVMVPCSTNTQVGIFKNSDVSKEQKSEFNDINSTLQKLPTLRELKKESDYSRSTERLEGPVIADTSISIENEVSTAPAEMKCDSEAVNPLVVTVTGISGDDAIHSNNINVSEDKKSLHDSGALSSANLTSKQSIIPNVSISESICSANNSTLNVPPSSTTTNTNLTVTGQKVDGVKTIKRSSAGGPWL